MRTVLLLLTTLILSLHEVDAQDPGSSFVNLGVCRMNLDRGLTIEQQLETIDLIAETGVKRLRLGLNPGAEEDVIAQIQHAHSLGIEVLLLIESRDTNFFVPGAPIFDNFPRLSDLDTARFRSSIGSFFQQCVAQGAIPDALQVFNEIATGFNGDVLEPPFLEIDYTTNWNDPVYERIRSGFLKTGEAMRITNELIDEYFNGEVFLMSAGLVSRTFFTGLDPNNRSRVLFQVLLDIWQGTHPDQPAGAENYLQYIDGFGLHLYPGGLYEDTPQQVLTSFFEPRINTYLATINTPLPICLSEWGIRKDRVQEPDVERERYRFQKEFLAYLNNDESVEYDWAMLFDFDRSTNYNTYDNGFLISSEILGDYPDFAPRDTCARTTQQFEDMPRESTSPLIFTDDQEASADFHEILPATGAGDEVTFTFCHDQEGYYRLLFSGLQSNSSGIYRAELETLPGRWVPLGEDIDFYKDESGLLTHTLGPVYLQSGTYRIRFISTGKNAASSGYNGSFDVLNIEVVEDQQVCLENPGARVAEVEAESGQLENTTRIVACDDASEGEHIQFAATGDAASYTLEVPGAGDYLLLLDYFSNSTARNSRVEINGADLGNIFFPRSGQWCFQGGAPATMTVPVTLNAGSNTIRLSRETAAPLFDKIAIGSLSDSDNDGVADACDGNNATLPLKLTSMCSNKPESERRWRIRNPNDFSQEVWWEVVGTSQTDTLLAPSGDSFFFTQTVGGANTTKLYWKDGLGVTRSTVKASGGAICNTNQARILGEDEQQTLVGSMVRIYPNPISNSHLQLELLSEAGGIALISVSDTSGRLVVSEEYRLSAGKNKASIQLNELQRGGIYIIRIDHENYSETKKIIVE